MCLKELRGNKWLTSAVFYRVLEDNRKDLEVLLGAGRLGGGSESDQEVQTENEWEGLYEKYEETRIPSRCQELDKDGRDVGLEDVEDWP
jgi:hypothetical protein